MLLQIRNAIGRNYKAWGLSVIFFVALTEYYRDYWLGVVAGMMLAISGWAALGTDKGVEGDRLERKKPFFKWAIGVGVCVALLSGSMALNWP